MAEPPPLYVPAPVATPARFGLLTAAVTPDQSDPHWQNGVQYEPLASGKAFGTHDPCRADAPDLVVPEGVPFQNASPFTVYAGFNCKLIGRSLEEIAQRAEAALRVGEQRAVERIYWTGEEGNTPRLADPSAQVLGDSAATPVSLAIGLALLEEYLGTEYGNEGVLHGRRGLVPLLCERNSLVQREGARLTTTLGNTFVAGAGYAVNTGPDGTPAPAGTSWLYATSPVLLLRSEPFVNPDDVRLGLDRKTNRVQLLAERTYVVSHDSVLAAVRVNV